MSHRLSIKTIKAMLDSDDRTKSLHFSNEMLHTLAYHFDSYHDDAVRQEFGTTMVMCLYVPEYKLRLQEAYKTASKETVSMAQFLYIESNRVSLPREATWIEKYELANKARKVHTEDAKSIRNMLLEPEPEVEAIDIDINDFTEDLPF